MPKYIYIQEWTNLITHKNLEDTDVSHHVPLRWDGPKTPASPTEQLIGMGFTDRRLNAQHLDKHNNNLTEVLNELLDNHHQVFGGSNNVVWPATDIWPIYAHYNFTSP